MKFGYVVELDATNMFKVSKCLECLITRYGTTCSLLNEWGCNLQNALEVLCLTFPTEFEVFLKKLKF